MSVAYEQSTFSLVGARVRRIVLGIVLFTSLAVNIVFAICTLVNPVSIYAVLVFAIIISAVGYLIEYTLADAEEVADTVMSDMHPALLRAPVCMSYKWIVGAWLAWWFIPQLLWAADIVYQHSLVSTLVIVPLLFLYIMLRMLNRAPELWASLESFLLLALQFASFVALFFPSVEWAPQYIGVLAVCVRVLLFFVGVMLATFLEPPHWDVSLDDDARPLLNIEVEIKNLMQNTLLDSEGGMSTQQRQRRFERARAILAAHARIDAEQRRMRDIVALTAWVLVLPLRAVISVYPVLLFSMIYDSAKSKRVRVAALAQPVPPEPANVPPRAPSVVPVAQTPAIVVSPTVEAESSANLIDKSRLRPAVLPATLRAPLKP